MRVVLSEVETWTEIVSPSFVVRDCGRMLMATPLFPGSRNLDGGVARGPVGAVRGARTGFPVVRWNKIPLIRQHAFLPIHPEVERREPRLKSPLQPPVI